MKYFRNAIFFYASFSEKSGRIEYGLYAFFTILLHALALHLHRTIDLNNETILHFFYCCFIVLFTFVPMQAVTTRRLRDLNVNPAFLVFNFIPVLNLTFIAFLLFAKKGLKNN
ncbi:DUF805 domain-containing protein [Flavobacterium sp. 245]|uniref:DUF805 domain-containing protein n=1 Tax=Flavobacterium sp. 245 TaxID=2512115 RepID=UPI00106018ED|nr:DUF805 domain-containing protein [Flavobacterium sp. 245]TDP02890.1 uncharacterized membrane protein YhaH (DUF805 family) [Flavobacterium sp. 245]